MEGEEWVGLTILQSTSPDLAWNAMTGVIPSHRGRGLARAPKALAAEHARRQGIRAIATRNNVRNAPMLAVNEALGYRRQQGEWRLRKELRTG
jgi:RimJ/RimL family protein N-acetyltransferase